MAFCRIVFPLLVLSVVTASNVPVFLWGDLAKTSVKSNPLTTITAPEFEAILKGEEKDDPLIAVFIEKTLSPEDFSLKDKGEVSLPYLHENLGDSLYLPSVESPMRVLEAFAEKNDKIQLITLEDADDNESKFETLRRHNDVIAEKFDKLKEKNDNVIGVYTAHYPSWSVPITHSRVRRQANITTVSPPDYMLNGLRLYVKDIKLTTANATSNITGFVSSESVINETIVSSAMNFGETTLTLNFRSSGGYWFFDTVHLKQTNPTVDEVLYPTSDVEAFLGFSYRCKQLVSFTSVNETVQYTITFEDLKVQPFFEATNDTVMPFGESLNCVGFFSAPIWSGLFVVFILLAITFYGIMMMMDIRTMDRFDDPKGKTITINAAE